MVATPHDVIYTSLRNTFMRLEAAVKSHLRCRETELEEVQGVMMGDGV